MIFKIKTIATLLICLFGFSVLAEEFVPVCERTKQVSMVITSYFGFDCKNIKPNQLSTIRHLGLGSRKISNLKSGDFSGLQNLEYLDLSENRISHVPEDIFNGLKNLKMLILDSNPILILSPRSFIGLSNLGFLSLNKTQLTRIEPGTFDPLIEVGTISFAGSKNLQHIPDLAFIKNTKIITVSTLKCPLNLTGPSAFVGVQHLIGLPSTFNVDPEFSWENE